MSVSSDSRQSSEAKAGEDEEELSKTVTAGDLALSGGVNAVLPRQKEKARQSPKIHPLIKLHDDEETVRRNIILY